jgi:large subunit ribosomal protein L22
MTQMNDSKLQVRALGKNIRMSPHKVRKVIDQIRGRSYEEALMLLTFMPYKACDPILKVICSAAANASHNCGLRKSSLYITEAKIDKGPLLKRFRPRAQGRGFPISKPTCYITIVMMSRT